ncbi:MAG: hypothetical protein MUP02_07055, partial [Actinobacteria bacterium]|nr:hypothetical protein [Actinomycetota bacterium]
RYSKASKKQKTKTLDEFCATTGYNRCYASWILKIKSGKVPGYNGSMHLKRSGTLFKGFHL